MINWTTVMLLVVISIPGIHIIVPRMVSHMLPDAPEITRKRAGLLIWGQLYLTVCLTAVAGAFFSQKNGLPVNPVLPASSGQEVGGLMAQQLVQILQVSLMTLLGFVIVYYALFRPLIKPETYIALTRMRRALKIDGVVLYGAIAEEVMVRFGLFNLLLFFGRFFSQEATLRVTILCMLLSVLAYSATQIPLYIANGCQSDRRLAAMIICLNFVVATGMTYLYVKFGLVAAMIGHMLFFLCWWPVDEWFAGKE